jgi:hypothetical protein
VIDGPEGNTYIESETFCYRDINEFQESRSIGVQISGIWDPYNLETGSKIPATVSEDYHHKVEKGATKATIVGTDVGGEDPLHIRDLVNSDDLAHLVRARDSVQERNTVTDKHVRVFLPIPSFVLKGIRNALFADQANENQRPRPMSVDEFDTLIAEGIQEAQAEQHGNEVDYSSDFSKDELTTDEVTFVDGEYHEEFTYGDQTAWGYNLAEDGGICNSPDSVFPGNQVFPVDLTGEFGEILVRTRILVNGGEGVSVTEPVSVIEKNAETGDLDINYRNGNVAIVATVDRDALEKYRSYPGQEDFGKGLTAQDWLDVVTSSVVVKAAIGADNVLLNAAQGAVELVGMVPLFGDTLDLANAACYELRGQHEDAVFAASSAIPVLGMIAAGGKYLKNGWKWVGGWTGLSKKTGKVVNELADTSNLAKPLGHGSTGRVIPRNLHEQMAMKEVMANPNAGKVLDHIQMKDSRWPSDEGWVKMSQYVNEVEIHYVKNVKTGAVDDFKFKN